MRSWWIPIAAFLGMTSVGLGAYVSHGLGSMVDPALREAARASLHMAVQQQMFHALALLALGVLALQATPNRWLCAGAALWIVGIVLFSGLIYLRAFTGIDSMRSLVPWGGTCLMLGWIAAGVGGWKAARSA
jgi:uncharacterized membrane protein YgdD (TMEM256/DUF423 family)